MRKNESSLTIKGLSIHDNTALEVGVNDFVTTLSKPKYLMS